jgi:hypothetical protein
VSGSLGISFPAQPDIASAERTGLVMLQPPATAIEMKSLVSGFETYAAANDVARTPENFTSYQRSLVAAGVERTSVESSNVSGSPLTPKPGLLAREDGSFYDGLGISDEKSVRAAENVIKNSAFGRAPENAELVRNAIGSNVKVVAGMGEGQYGQLVRKPDLDYPRVIPNMTGEAKIIINPDVLKNPKLAACVILHESVHQAQLWANPRASKETLTTIQSEVKAYAVEMKLWKELRGEFIDKSGNPKQGLTSFEQAIVRSNEKIYRAQQRGGDAGIKNEIRSYPVYRDVIDLDFERKHKPQPGPSDRSLVP